MENLRKEDGKKILIWAWVCVVGILITPLFAIGGIILGNKYKKYDEKKGKQIVIMSIIGGVLMFYFSLKFAMGW
ncbi:hypothetical protein L2Z53_08745 [Macrococcoides canis]|uniref:hypothetical protein n=1 Tax=Macrococcoides canis TaxID=1855823 RepID=UPI001F2F30B6|nr:hypothetical protein [Macrococcus canis]UJS27250.1 hypothetical protein L2Z53_08705 [Macrococcus canis]UJS27257.1 hypothetical protein L2Z53_08745 [Macrococcus canis]